MNIGVEIAGGSEIKKERELTIVNVVLRYYQAKLLLRGARELDSLENKLRHKKGCLRSTHLLSLHVLLEVCLGS